MKMRLKALRRILVLLLFPAVAVAHIGSPDVYFEGKAGPYSVRVVVRVPPVIPGVAEVEVRKNLACNRTRSTIRMSPGQTTLVQARKRALRNAPIAVTPPIGVSTAGFAVRPYHVAVPSFGARLKMKLAARKLPAPGMFCTTTRGSPGMWRPR